MVKQEMARLDIDLLGINELKCTSSHVWMWKFDYKESWGPKNWCFWTVVVEKTLESPLDCKEIQPSILKEISPGCSLEGLMLKLKLQYFGHLMRKADSFEKTLMLGKIEGRWRRGRQRMRWLDGVTDSMDRFGWTVGVGDGQGGLVCCGSWGGKESDMTEWLNWTELKWTEMGEFNSDDHYIYYCGQESLRRNGVALTVNKRVQTAVLGCNLKNERMVSVRF